MPLANVDFYQDQGASFTRTITYTDSTGNNAFASAVSAEGMVRVEPYSNNIIATMNCVFSTANSSNLPYPDTLTISLSNANTQAFPNNVKILPYDVKVVFADGSETFVLGGRFIVNFTVTRP